MSATLLRRASHLPEKKSALKLPCYSCFSCHSCKKDRKNKKNRNFQFSIFNFQFPPRVGFAERFLCQTSEQLRSLLDANEELAMRRVVQKAPARHTRPRDVLALFLSPQKTLRQLPKWLYPLGTYFEACERVHCLGEVSINLPLGNLFHTQ